jgi:hypothetical protein
MSSTTGTSLKDRIKALENAGFKDTLVKKRVPAYAAPLQQTRDDNIVYETNNDHSSRSRQNPNINLVHYNHAGKSTYNDDELLPRNRLLNEIRQRGSKSPDSIENVRSRSMSRDSNDASPVYDGSQFVSPNMDMKFINDSRAYERQSPDDEDLNDLDLDMDHEHSIVPKTHDDHFYENDMDLHRRMSEPDDDEGDQDEVNSCHRAHSDHSVDIIKKPMQHNQENQVKNDYSSSYSNHGHHSRIDHGVSHGNHVIHLGSREQLKNSGAYADRTVVNNVMKKNTVSQNKTASNSGVSSSSIATKKRDTNQIVFQQFLKSFIKIV